MQRMERWGAYRSRLRLHRLMAVLVFGWLACVPLVAQAVKSDEASLKIAFLYNFLKLADWSAQNDSEVELCITEHNPFGDVVNALLGREVQNRPLRVRVVELTDRMDQCRLLFITGRPDDWLKAVRGTKLLTVSDRADFIEQGGMIGLLSHGNRLQFEINLPAVVGHGVQLRAQLLQLAKRIIKD